MSPQSWLWTALASVAAGGCFSALFHALSDLSRPTLERVVRKSSHARLASSSQA